MGIDLSERMVGLAREASPAIAFRAGDMLALQAADAAWAGIGRALLTRLRKTARL